MAAARPSSGRPRAVGKNRVGGLLGEHVDGSYGEVAGDARKNGGVDHAQTAEAVDAEAAVDHSAGRARLHRAGAAGMMAPGIVLNVGLERIVRSAVPARLFLL